MRDSRGADWGRYFRNKNKPSEQKENLPAIYLAYKFSTNDSLIIKLGRTSRSPDARVKEINYGDFKIYTFWSMPEEILSKCEKYTLAELNIELGDPIRGKETFVAESLVKTKQLLDSKILSFLRKEENK